jgi:hypothetical protein
MFAFLPPMIALVTRSRFVPTMVTVVPAGTVFVEIPKPGAVTTGIGEIEPENTLENDPALLDAVTVKLYAPTPVGVPEICPVAAFKLNPAGRVPAVTA